MIKIHDIRKVQDPFVLYPKKIIQVTIRVPHNNLYRLVQLNLPNVGFNTCLNNTHFDNQEGEFVDFMTSTYLMKRFDITSLHHGLKIENYTKSIKKAMRLEEDFKNNSINGNPKRNTRLSGSQ